MSKIVIIIIIIIIDSRVLVGKMASMVSQRSWPVGAAKHLQMIGFWLEKRMITTHVGWHWQSIWELTVPKRSEMRRRRALMVIIFRACYSWYWVEKVPLAKLLRPGRTGSDVCLDVMIGKSKIERVYSVISVGYQEDLHPSSWMSNIER